MRTTRASNAVLRLKQRDPNNQYSMLTMSDGRLCLTITSKENTISKLNEPLELDAFVTFVNGIKRPSAKKTKQTRYRFRKATEKIVRPFDQIFVTANHIVTPASYLPFKVAAKLG